jgi:hypothetical protein
VALQADLAKEVAAADYPSPLPQVNQTAPVPRRIRAVLNGRVVLDTTSAL